MFRQCCHHSAQSSEGEGGEGHASENGSAAARPRRAAAARAKRTPSRTHELRRWQGHPAATGEEEGDKSVKVISRWTDDFHQTVETFQFKGLDDLNNC